jgi:transcriptional regulator with XRE-family HTH domain
LSHVARKFERLLEAYHHEGGGKWSGIELERATGGVVTRSYVTNLCKGRIENPGLDKLAALAKAMGLPPTLWFEEELSGTDGRSRGDPHRARGQGRAPVRCDQGPEDGGSLHERQGRPHEPGRSQRGRRRGDKGRLHCRPPLSHVIALASAFGVEPYYLVDGTGEAVLDREIVEALSDVTIRAIAATCAEPTRFRSSRR